MPIPPVPAAEAARRRTHIRRLRRRVMVFVIGIPVLLLAVALYFAFGPKPPPPPVVLPVSPVQAAAATQRIDAVRQALTGGALPAPPRHAATGYRVKSAGHHPQIQPLQSPASPQPVVTTRGPNGQPLVTMRVSQADVNAYLTTNPKTRGLMRSHGVRAISVQFDPPDNITIHAAATLRGVSGNGLITATMTPDPHTAIALHITEARFGRLPPPVIKSAVQAIAARLLGRSHGLLPLDIRTVRVAGTDLILTGAQRASGQG